MSNVLDGISQDIAKAIEFAAKIADDVKRLDAKIAALPPSASAEEIAAVKAQSAALVARLTATDDLTPDEVVSTGTTSTPPVTPPTGTTGVETPPVVAPTTQPTQTI